jgi:hypothetical protein
MVDTETGEHTEKRLMPSEAIQFYTQLHGPVLVGMEGCGNTLWFERLLAELGTISGWEMRARSVLWKCAIRKRIGVTRSCCCGY